MKQYSEDQYRNQYKPNYGRDSESNKGDTSFLDHYANNGFDGYDLNKESNNSNNSEQIKGGTNSILVAIRVRPLNSKEIAISNFETIKILEQKIVCLLDPQSELNGNDALRSNRNRERQYGFDYAFDKDTATQTVYNHTTRFLIEGVINGFNATVFAYGATGAGKTYTILGMSDRPGIMNLTVNELFIEADRNKSFKNFSIKLSYLEVYNETIRDLLSSEDTNLDLREDPEKGVCVAGLSEFDVSAISDVINLIRIGNKNRVMEPTAANVVSSRSHAVLQITVESRDRGQGLEEEVLIGKLSLIDLAGSERATHTNNKGLRMIEGANINKSLLALGNCITVLSEQNDKGIKANFIPYRDSKLTRLLKDSLGGNCRTVMIANVSPAVICYEDTHNTLKYAHRAKNIKTKLMKNIINVANPVAKYTNIINNLKQENENLKKMIQDKNTIISPSNNNNNVMNNNAGGNGGGNGTGLMIMNEKLHNDIQTHFETEIEMKKKIFELDENCDQINEQMLKLKNEMNPNSTANKDKMLVLKDTHRNLNVKIEQLQQEYGNNVLPKRNQLLNDIQKEKNKEAIAYFNTLFKQYQYNVENMDFQNRERKVQYQLKAKELEIVYLQNQLNLKEDKKKDSKSGSIYQARSTNNEEKTISSPRGNNPNNPNIINNDYFMNQKHKPTSNSTPSLEGVEFPMVKVGNPSSARAKQVYSINKPSYSVLKRNSSNDKYLQKGLIVRDYQKYKVPRGSGSRKKVGIEHLLLSDESRIESLTSFEGQEKRSNNANNISATKIRRPIPIDKQVIIKRKPKNIAGNNSRASPKNAHSEDHSFVSTASDSQTIDNLSKKKILNNLNTRKTKQTLPPIITSPKKHKIIGVHQFLPSRFGASPFIKKFKEKNDRKPLLSDELTAHIINRSPKMAKFFSKNRSVMNLKSPSLQ